jgi:hypothetical protein
VDPDLQLTNQAYVFVDDNPLNSVDPLGLKNKKILKTKSEVVFYSVPVGINGEVKIKNVINALYVATPYSKTLVSLSFGNKTASYGTGISSDYPVDIKPTLYIIETLGGHKVKVGTVTFNVSVCCGDSTSPEYDPGTEEIISPEPAVGLTSYQNSVTFAVAYTTPAH